MNKVCIFFRNQGIIINNTVGFTVLLWDLGGKDILRPIWRKYYPECFGIVFVIDGSNEDKLEDSLAALSKYPFRNFSNANNGK